MSNRPADLSATALTGSAPYVRRKPSPAAVPFPAWAVPAKKRTRAVDRTRSKAWRAGTRRTRHRAAAAVKLGLPHPLAKGEARTPPRRQEVWPVILIDEAHVWRSGGQ